MAEVIYIVCPFCGMNRKLEKTGKEAIAKGLDIDVKDIKGRIRFDQIDIKTGCFEDTRLASGGSHGSGFPRIKCRSLVEIIRNNEYPDLIEQIDKKAKEIQSNIALNSPL